MNTQPSTPQADSCQYPGCPQEGVNNLGWCRSHYLGNPTDTNPPDAPVLPTPDKPAATQPLCGVCGEPMPVGEEMFKYHGYSGDCPKPPMKKCLTCSNRLSAESEYNLCDTCLVDEPAPEPLSVEAILLDYRSRIAELIADHHSHGITTAQLVAIDKRAIEALQSKREAELREARIDELKNIPFNERDKTCMDCTATSKVDERIAKLKGVSDE